MCAIDNAIVFANDKTLVFANDKALVFAIDKTRYWQSTKLYIDHD